MKELYDGEVYIGNYQKEIQESLQRYLTVGDFTALHSTEPYGPIEKCPFCKHNASPNSLSSYVWVECDNDNCKARGPRISAPWDLNKRTPAYTEAVRIWNTTMQAMTSEKSPSPPGEK
jgi:hypothetical protein